MHLIMAVCRDRWGQEVGVEEISKLGAHWSNQHYLEGETGLLRGWSVFCVGAVPVPQAVFAAVFQP